MTPEMQMQELLAMAIRSEQDKQKDAQQMELSIADLLGEEGLKEQLAMHTVPQRMGLAGQQMGAEDDVLQRQLVQAQAIRKGSGGRNFGTVGGNVAAGIGDALGSFFGGMRENQTLEAMRGNNAAGFGAQGALLDRMDNAGFRGLKAQHGVMCGMFPGAKPPMPPIANASSFGDGVQLVPFELPKKQEPMAMSQLLGMKLPFLGG